MLFAVFIIAGTPVLVPECTCLLVRGLECTFLGFIAVHSFTVCLLKSTFQKVMLVPLKQILQENGKDGKLQAQPATLSGYYLFRYTTVFE